MLDERRIDRPSIAVAAADASLSSAPSGSASTQPIDDINDRPAPIGLAAIARHARHLRPAPHAFRGHMSRASAACMNSVACLHDARERRKTPCRTCAGTSLHRATYVPARPTRPASIDDSGVRLPTDGATHARADSTQTTPRDDDRRRSQSGRARFRARASCVTEPRASPPDRSVQRVADASAKRGAWRRASPRTQSRNESTSHACTSCAAHRCVVDARRSMLAGRHQQADTRRSRTPAADRHALAAPAHSTVDDSALRSLGGRFTKQPALSSLLRAPHDARGTSRCRQPAVEHHATTWHRIVTASARRSAAIERRMSRCLAATSPRSPLPATSDNVHSRRHSTAFDGIRGARA
ncbi:hypothetical protein X946_430 [Burkholderia sp. ABCPW 111]|nr:hypothetical protein X946_430 [Burkholderia sp. ABCPW 111]